MKTEEDRVFFFSYTCRVGQREIIKHQILETSHIDPLVEEDSSAGEGLVLIQTTKNTCAQKDFPGGKYR